jgi:hypothetical protein
MYDTNTSPTVPKSPSVPSLRKGVNWALTSPPPTSTSERPYRRKNVRMVSRTITSTRSSPLDSLAPTMFKTANRIVNTIAVPITGTWNTSPR